jgi:hypothetical protein
MREMTLDRNILEIESVCRIHYFATAAVAGWTFPSLWVPIRRLHRFYERGGESTRKSIIRLLVDASLAQFSSPPGTLRDLIATNTCVKNLNIEIARRSYFVLTELFNFAVKGIFTLTSREWLAPWSLWKYFLVEPWDINEYRFVRLCAAVFSVTPEEVISHCRGGEEIHRTVIHFAEHDMEARATLPSNDLFETDFQRLFSHQLRAYMRNGAITWRTRFGRYTIWSTKR